MEILTITIISAVIFLVFRFFFLWYWKVDVMIDAMTKATNSLETQSRLILAIAQKLEVDPARLKTIADSPRASDINPNAQKSTAYRAGEKLAKIATGQNATKPSATQPADNKE